ncbi:MAG: hypothetical protein ABIS29_14745 [Vicinamibacterales bacterium]
MSLPAVVSAQNAAATTAAPPAVATAQAPRPGAANPPARPRRRGTMVGYIADGTIANYVRVRFDAGYDNNVPDRAEFFYAQCGCNGGGAPGPGSPGAQDLTTSLNFQQLVVDFQYAPHERVAVFGSVPLRFVQPQSFLGETLRPAQTNNTFEGGSGLSDIRAGVKASLFSNDTSLLSAQFQFFFPSGDPKKGLGTDHTSFESALLFHQTLSDRLTIESQFGDWHPIGGSSAGRTDYAGDVLFYGVGPSYELVNNGRLRFAPVVELVGWRVLGGQQQFAGTLGPAEGTNIVNLKFGARTTFDEVSSLYVGYGHSLTDDVWYNNILRVEYKYSF